MKLKKQGSRLFGKGEHHRVEITVVSLRGIKVSSANDGKDGSATSNRKESPVCAIVSFSRKDTGATSLPSQALSVQSDGSNCTATWEYDPVYDREGGVLSFKTRLAKNQKNMTLSLNEHGSIAGGSEVSSLGSSSVFSTACIDGKTFDVVVGLVQNSSTIILGTSQLIVRPGATSGMMEIYLRGASNTSEGQQTQAGISFPNDGRNFSLDTDASLRAHVTVMTAKDYERALHTKEQARSFTRMAMSPRSLHDDNMSLSSHQQSGMWQSSTGGKPGRPPAYPLQIIHKKMSDLASKRGCETSPNRIVEELPDRAQLASSYSSENCEKSKRGSTSDKSPPKDENSETKENGGNNVNISTTEQSKQKEKFIPPPSIIEQRDDIEERAPEDENEQRDAPSPTAEGGISSALEEARREIRHAAMRAQRRYNHRDGDHSGSALSPSSSFSSSASGTDVSESLFSGESSVMTDASSVHTNGSIQDKENGLTYFFDLLCPEPNRNNVREKQMRRRPVGTKQYTLPPRK